MQAPNVDNIILEGAKKPKKNIDITLWGLWGRGKDSRLEPEVFTPSGWPAVSTPILRSMAGKPGIAKKALADLEGASADNDSGREVFFSYPAIWNHKLNRSVRLLREAISVSDMPLKKWSYILSP